MQLFLATERAGKVFPIARVTDPAIVRRACRSVYLRRQREMRVLGELAGLPTKCTRRTAKKAKGQS